MPRVLYRELRFHVIDRCLRDLHTLYNIHDLRDACNEVLHEAYGVSVSLRSVQYDLSILRSAPYSIDLDEELLRRGYYRYADPHCSVSFIAPPIDSRANDGMVVCSVRIAQSAVARFEELIVAMGETAVIDSPVDMRHNIYQRLRNVARQYEPS